jgi:hypothetical protein
MESIMSTHVSDPSTRPIFETIESAAIKLAVEPAALRSRCRRAARRAGDAKVAELGGGIVAFKFGQTWRIRFPSL